MGVLQFFLDKNVYITGDFINGKLEFIKGRHVSVDGVYVDLIITEMAHDSLSDSYRTKSNVLHKTRLCLAGGKGTKGFSIDGGTYSWPFKVQIPNGLPSAVSHPTGRAKVLFELKGFIDALGAGKEVVRALTVYCQKDLQQVPFDPPTKKDEKKFFMSKGTLQLESKLDRSLAYPGAQIFAEISFVNESSKKLTSLAINVVQLWKLKKSTDRVVTKQYKFTPPEFPIAPGGKFKGRIGFNIPENLPLTTNVTTLFNLFYVVCVEGYVGNTSEISVDLPLLMTMAFTQPAKEVVTVHTHTIQHVPVFVPVHNMPPNYPPGNNYPMPPPYQQPPPNFPPTNNYPYNPLGGSLPMGKPQPPPPEVERPRSQSMGMQFSAKPLPSVPYTNPPQQYENPPMYYEAPPSVYDNPPIYPTVPDTKLPQFPTVAPSAPPMYN